ncbi:MAG: integrase arm-type DNA-binding domain-containing protein [Rhodocyclales bacterium]|nr:integrase arm-type DNA-binding domain-containing protein [Rhodocyclales bacterium]
MLTDTAIKKAKPSTKPVRMFDGGGLYLELAISGGKLWRFKYRFDGKEKRQALGSYPDTSLAKAREKRDEARRLLADGIDPSEHRKAHKATRAEVAGNTFEAIGREWYSKELPLWAPTQAVKVKGIFEKNLYPWLGSRPITEIKASEFLATLRRMENRGAMETARRALQYSGQVFRYAIATGRAERDITPDLRGALSKANVQHHAVKCALKLAALLFVRPGELRKAEWTEIDLDRAEWNIPASRMKMKEAHLVPLCRQALEVLRELHPLTGRGRFVFPGERSHERPMSENSVNAALRCMGYPQDEMTGHGFRAMARTILDEVLGVRPDFIEHQLAHAVKDPNGRAYNRTAHLPERRKMMQQWADYLDKLKAGAEVIPLHGNAA